MPYKTGFITTVVLWSILLSVVPASSEQEFWDLPPLPAAYEYGNVLINRISVKNGIKPVAFSHWTHRQKYTCRVCHFELEFNMKVNTTEITEVANKEGRYCGTGGCHDGKTAFGHNKPHCEKCHNGNRGYGKEKFSELLNFPKSNFGNGVNWVKALEKGMITPVNYLAIKPADEISYDKGFSLEAEWTGIPLAVFSHRPHIRWLDCNNCHPDIFNIKKKTTKHFEMKRILNGEFCGVCHMTVAFPINDCRRCHPEMRE